MTATLEVDALNVDYFQHGTIARATRDVSFTIPTGRATALVGESGCGKSTVALSIMRLIRPPIGDIASGAIRLNGRELTTMTAGSMRDVLHHDIGYVPQDPTTALDPLCTVGRHITETLSNGSRRQRRDAAVQILERLGVPRAAERIHSYPHEFSGGMRQRVAIGAALAKDPALLIADEPTTALDVTTQLAIIRLLRGLARERDLTLLFVTHDLSVARALCNDVLVMYAGRIVESGPISDVLAAPRHPYTRALIDCLPHLATRRSQLAVIDGQPPQPTEEVGGCPFAPRCPLAEQRCREQRPEYVQVGSSSVACWKAGIAA